MMIIVTESRKKSLASFVTGVCAIVGGVLTVAGLVDRGVYEAERRYQKKVMEGKHL